MTEARTVIPENCCVFFHAGEECKQIERSRARHGAVFVRLIYFGVFHFLVSDLIW